MTDRVRINGSAQPDQQPDVRPEYIPSRGDNHRRFNKPKILQPGDPHIGTVEAAGIADISPRQMQTWCECHQIGRKIAGHKRVDPRLLAMFMAGDTGAHDDYLHGDRTSERVLSYTEASDI